MYLRIPDILDHRIGRTYKDIDFMILHKKMLSFISIDQLLFIIDILFDIYGVIFRIP